MNCTDVCLATEGTDWTTILIVSFIIFTIILIMSIREVRRRATVRRLVHSENRQTEKDKAQDKSK